MIISSSKVILYSDFKYKCKHANLISYNLLNFLTNTALFLQEFFPLFQERPYR